MLLRVSRYLLSVAVMACALAVWSCSGSGPRTVLEQAEDAWDSGDYKQSAQLYERFLEQEPAGVRAADARYQLANIYYFNLRRFDQARANYAAFLEQDPGNQNAPMAR